MDADELKHVQMGGNKGGWVEKGGWLVENGCGWGYGTLVHLNKN